MSFCRQNFFQKTNETFSTISALASKKRSNQKSSQTKIIQLVVSSALIFLFDLFLKARVEILGKISLVFWTGLILEEVLTPKGHFEII